MILFHYNFKLFSSYFDRKKREKQTGFFASLFQLNKLVKLKKPVGLTEISFWAIFHQTNMLLITWILIVFSSSIFLSPCQTLEIPSPRSSFDLQFSVLIVLGSNAEMYADRIAAGSKRSIRDRLNIDLPEDVGRSRKTNSKRFGWCFSLCDCSL